MPERQGRRPASPPTARVVDVVEALAQQPDRRWSLTDLVRATGVTQATAHAVLGTLAERGWVRRHESDRSYTIGPYLIGLGRRAGGAHTLERAAHDQIAKLAVELGHRVMVVHRLADTLVVTDVSAPPGRRPGVEIGSRIPYLPPFGPGFAAWAGPAEAAAWLGHAERINPALADRLTRVLPEIRRRGYSLERLDATSAAAFEVLGRLQDDVFGDAVREVIGRVLADLTLVDFLPGELGEDGEHPVTSIAVPVHDADGAVALNLAVQPRSALPRAELDRLGRALGAAAAAVEAEAR